MDKRFVAFAAIVLILVVCLFLYNVPAKGQLESPSNLNGLHLSQSSFGTATPQLLIANSGNNKSIEVRNSSSTPVWSVNADGSTTGSLGETNSSNLVVNAPTAIGTATPAVLINNAGVSRLLEVQDGGTTIFAMNNGGSSSFAAPTAIATANPALIVDSAGVSNLLEVRDAATPQFTINNGGASTFASDLTTAGVVAWDDTDSALTGAQTITPTYSYLQVSPTAVLTITLATGSAADGDLLIVHNLVATQTDIIDTGATVGGGNINLGQDDIAIFIFGDGVWVEIASPDNS